MPTQSFVLGGQNTQQEEFKPMTFRRRRSSSAVETEDEGESGPINT